MTAPAEAKAAAPVLVKYTKHIAVTVPVGLCRKYAYSLVHRKYRWNMNKWWGWENVFIRREEYKLPVMHKPLRPSA